MGFPPPPRSNTSPCNRSGGGQDAASHPLPVCPKAGGGGEGNLGQEEERGPWGGKLGQMGWELWEHGALLRAAPGGKHIHGGGGGQGVSPGRGQGECQQTLFNK